MRQPEVSRLPTNRSPEQAVGWIPHGVSGDADGKGATWVDMHDLAWVLWGTIRVRIDNQQLPRDKLGPQENQLHSALWSLVGLDVL